MPKTTKKKPARVRKGYVMVELDSEERTKLERLRDERQATTAHKVSLSSVLRQLLMTAEFEIPE